MGETSSQLGRTVVLAECYERIRHDEHVHVCALKIKHYAHLANRAHYTGGWTIDPSVEE